MAGYTAEYRSAFELAQGLVEAEATGTRAPGQIERRTVIRGVARHYGHELLQIGVD